MTEPTKPSEFARYLASFLIGNQQHFAGCSYPGAEVVLDFGELSELIQTFQDTLP